MLAKIARGPGGKIVAMEKFRVGCGRIDKESFHSCPADEKFLFERRYGLNARPWRMRAGLVP